MVLDEGGVGGRAGGHWGLSLEEGCPEPWGWLVLWLKLQT